MEEERQMLEVFPATVEAARSMTTSGIRGDALTVKYGGPLSGQFETDHMGRG